MKKALTIVILALIVAGGSVFWVYLFSDPVPLLASDDYHTREKALNKLVYRGVSVVPHLVQEYPKGTEKEKVGIIAALGKIGDRHGLDIIIKALNDPNKTIRDNAHYALEEMFTLHKVGLDKSVIPVLINLLEDNDYASSPPFPYGEHDMYDLCRSMPDKINQRALCYFNLDINVPMEISDELTQIEGKSGMEWDDNTPLAQEKWTKIKQLLTKFWEENKDYLYLITENTPYLPYCFTIDQEAKTAGIPTDEYRKTHPWPPRPKMSGGFQGNQYSEYLKAQENKVKEIVKRHCRPLKIESIGQDVKSGVWSADVYMPVDNQKDYWFEPVEITDDNGRKVMGQGYHFEVDIDTGKILKEGESGDKFVKRKLWGRKTDTNYFVCKEGKNAKCLIISEAVKNPVIWDTFDDKGMYVILPDNTIVRHDDHKCLLILVNLIGEIHTSYIKVSEQEVDQLFRIFSEQTKPENYFWKTRQHLGDDRFDEDTLKFLSGE